jgi:hypothetical protein
VAFIAQMNRDFIKATLMGAGEAKAADNSGG